MKKIFTIIIFAVLSIPFSGLFAQNHYPADLYVSPDPSNADLTAIVNNWETIKEWKSLNSERYNLIEDYVNPNAHVMVIKGRVGIHNIAEKLENTGMATFRMSFTMLVKSTPSGIKSEFTHVMFDYYITSGYINYNSVSIGDMEAIRDELLDFIRISRRFGNPVTLDEGFSGYGKVSDIAQRINNQSGYTLSEILESIRDMNDPKMKF